MQLPCSRHGYDNHAAGLTMGSGYGNHASVQFGRHITLNTLLQRLNTAPLHVLEFFTQVSLEGRITRELRVQLTLYHAEHE